MVPAFIETAQSYFYDIAVGIVILLLGFGLGILVKKILTKVLKEIELNKIMAKVGVRSNIEKWVSNIVSILIYVITIVYFLDQLGITSYVVWIILGAIFMLVILTFLVGLKDVIPNFVAWLLLQRKVKEGRRVSVREISGRVERVGFLETEIKTDNGDILYVPNSLFVKSKLWVRKD